MKRFTPAALFAVLLLAGVTVARDYGIGWDEMAMRYIGTSTLGHLRGDDAAWPLPPEIRYHGPVVEVPLALAERSLGLRDLRDVFLMRHLAGFLMLFAGAVTFFFFARRVLRELGWAVLATAVLVLAPRVFTDSFVNTKDVPAMSLFVGAMLTLLRLVERPSLVHATAHAAVTAFLIGLRAPGVLVPALTFAMMGSAAFRAWKTERGRATAGLRALAAYAALAVVFTVAVWPFLWDAPLAHLREALSAMSRVAWNEPVRYLGRDVPATELPWHYAPVWIAITTPLPVLLCFLVGSASALGTIARPGAAERRQTSFLLISWLMVPLLSVVALRSVIYDGWRHLTFVWPAIVLLAIEGARWIAAFVAPRIAKLGARVVRTAAVLGVASLVLPQLAFLVRWHPFGNVYFSVPASAVRGRFELDYWGLSYRQALEALLARDPSSTIRFAAPNTPAWDNLAILPAAERARLAPQESIEGARYYLTNFRGEHDVEPPGRPELAVVVDGLTILGVYRLEERASTTSRPPTPSPDPSAAGTALPPH